MKVRDLIESSLRLISVIQPGESATADDLDVSKEALTQLIDNLANSQLNTYTIVPKRYALVPNQQTYALGPELDDNGNPTNADWVTERPVRIDQTKLLMYPQIVGGEPTPPEYFFTYSARMTANTIQYADAYEAVLASTPATGVWDTTPANVPVRTVFPIDTLVVMVDLSTAAARTDVPLSTASYWEMEIGIEPGPGEYSVGAFTSGPFDIAFNPFYTPGSNPAYGTYYTSGGFILGAVSAVDTYTQGDVIGVLYNGDNTVTFFKNGTQVGSVSIETGGRPVYPIAGAYTAF